MIGINTKRYLAFQQENEKNDYGYVTISTFITNILGSTWTTITKEKILRDCKILLEKGMVYEVETMRKRKGYALKEGYTVDGL